MLRELSPYKPHVDAFVGEDVSDVFDIAYRDMSDNRPVKWINRLERGLCALCARRPRSRHHWKQEAGSRRLRGRTRAARGVLKPRLEHAKPSLS